MLTISSRDSLGLVQAFHSEKAEEVLLQVRSRKGFIPSLAVQSQCWKWSSLIAECILVNSFNPENPYPARFIIHLALSSFYHQKC